MDSFIYLKDSYSQGLLLFNYLTSHVEHYIQIHDVDCAAPLCAPFDLLIFMLRLVP